MRNSHKISKLLTTASGESGNVAENVALKEKNTELAKALADTQMLYKHAVEEKNYMQRELFIATLHIKKLENFISTIDDAARESINCIVTLSNHTTDILSQVNYSRRYSNESLKFNQTLNKSQSYSALHKTQAVKPMVDGHVIYSPTINLRRVNDLSETRRSASNVNERGCGDNNGQDETAINSSFQRQPSNNGIPFNHISERRHEVVDHDLENGEEDDLEESMHSNNIGLNINNGLSPVIEDEDERLRNSVMLESRRSSLTGNRNISHALSGNTAQLPILSGVFRDVRVYLSPVDPLPNITKVRGSSKTHKLKKSDTQPTRSTDNRSGPSSVENTTVNTGPHLDIGESSNPSLIDTLSENAFTSTPLTSILVNQSNNSSMISNHDRQIGNLSNHFNKVERRSTGHFNPKKLAFNRQSQPTTNFNRSINVHDDPLEGPSNLLETLQSNQVQTLLHLGLTPITAVSSPPKSASPAEAVVRRRKKKLINVNENTPEKFVTKRKLERKKSTILSSKVAKVIVPRILHSPLSPRNISVSPKKKSKLLTITKTSPQSPSALRINASNTPKIKKSPIKRERLKRSASKGTLKEPSLRKKLRRSK